MSAEFEVCADGGDGQAAVDIARRVAALGACGSLEKHLPTESLAIRLLDVLQGRPTATGVLPVASRGHTDVRRG